MIDLIRAQTDLALRSATEQLEGRLGDAIRKIRDGLIELIAQIEASIDFPEEGIAPDETDKLRRATRFAFVNKSPASSPPRNKDASCAKAYAW